MTKNQEEACPITKQEWRWLLEGLSFGPEECFQKNREKNKLISIFNNPMPEVEFNFSLQDFEKMLNFLLTATAYSAKIWV